MADVSRPEVLTPVQPAKPAERTPVGPSAAQPSEQGTGWRPDQHAGQPHKSNRPRKRMSLGRRAVLTGATLAAVGVGLDQGQGQDSQIQQTGSPEQGTTRTVDNTLASSSPLAVDLNTGTVKVNAPVVEAPVKTVNNESPLQTPTPPTPEDHTEPHAYTTDETVSKVIVGGYEATGLSRNDITVANVDVALAVTAAENPAHEHLDTVLDQNNGPKQTTLEMLDAAGLTAVKAASDGTNPDGSPADPAAVLKADAVERAVVENGYDSSEAQEKAVELLETLHIAVPDQTPPAPQPDQQNEPANGVEALGPTLSDTERTDYIRDAQEFGSVVVTDLTGDNIWDQQKERGDLNNATTNITSRLAVVLSQYHPDAAVNQEGKFDQYTMHHGDKFAEINPVLNPVIEGIASLSDEQMSQIQQNISPEAAQAVATIRAINHDQTDVPNRDKAAADVFLKISAMLDLRDIPAKHPGLQALLDQLQGKSPREAAVIIVQNAQALARELLDPAFPPIDNGVPGPVQGQEPTKVRITAGNITTDIVIPEAIAHPPANTPEAAQKEALRAFVDQQGNVLVSQGRVKGADAEDVADAIVKEAVEDRLGVDIIQIHPERDIDFDTPNGPIVVTIPERILNTTDAEIKANLFRQFIAQKAGEIKAKITDANITTDIIAARLTDQIERKVNVELTPTGQETTTDAAATTTPGAETTTRETTSAPATPGATTTESPAPATTTDAAAAPDRDPDSQPNNTNPLPAILTLTGLAAIAGGLKGFARRRARAEEIRNRYGTPQQIDVQISQLTDKDFHDASDRVNYNALTEAEMADPDNADDAGQIKNTFYTRHPDEMAEFMELRGMDEKTLKRTNKRLKREAAALRKGLQPGQEVVYAYSRVDSGQQDPDNPGQRLVFREIHAMVVEPKTAPQPQPQTNP